MKKKPSGKVFTPVILDSDLFYYEDERIVDDFKNGRLVPPPKGYDPIKLCQEAMINRGGVVYIEFDGKIGQVLPSPSDFDANSVRSLKMARSIWDFFDEECRKVFEEAP